MPAQRFYRPAEGDYSLLLAMATMVQPFIRHRQADEYMLYTVDVKPLLKITEKQFSRIWNAGYLVKVDLRTGTRYIMPDAARTHLARKVWKLRRNAETGEKGTMQMPENMRHTITQIT